MSKTHFNPDALCSTCHIKSAKMCSCCRKPKQPQLTIWETGPPGPGVAQLRTLLHAKQPHTHIHPHTHTHTNTHRVWWQTTVTLSSSIAGRSCWTSDTSHTAQRASAPLVSHCRHRGTARELLQLCRTNTEISLSKKHAVLLKEMSKYIPVPWPLIWSCN